MAVGWESSWKIQDTTLCANSDGNHSNHFYFFYSNSSVGRNGKFDRSLTLTFIDFFYLTFVDFKVSIGTLLAFTIVCACIIWLHYRDANDEKRGTYLVVVVIILAMLTSISVVQGTVGDFSCIILRMAYFGSDHWCYFYPWI